MKPKLLLILSSFLVIFFLITAATSLNRNILENDEGIYWATFLLVDKGFKLYEEISFSQLPGFFISTYSIFKLFGSTIFSARLGVLYWAVFSLISIVWLSYSRKNLLFSFSSLVLLLGIPVFFNQSITLQSDMLATSFSTISFILMSVYVLRKHQTKVFLIASSVFFSLAILTKFDYSLVLPFVFILLTEKKNKFLNIFLFTISSITVTHLILSFFGIQAVFNSVFALREKAAIIYSFDLVRLFKLLKSEVFLSFIIIANILFSLFRWKKDKFSVSLFLWFLSSLILTLSFRPVFNHHLVFLAVPAVLLFTNHILDLKISLYRYNDIKIVILIFIAVFSFFINIQRIAKRQNSRIIKDREVAKNFILQYSKPGDFIITDEAALYGMTGRLSPPEVIDLSEVQILSGNLSEETMKKALHTYKPKLILVWNGRLNPLKTVIESDLNYKIVEVYKEKNLYIRY